MKKFDKFHGTAHRAEFLVGCAALCEMTDMVQTEVLPMINSIQKRSLFFYILSVVVIPRFYSYAASFCGGDKATAVDELSQALSEMLVWDRGTVWHDLIRLER